MMQSRYLIGTQKSVGKQETGNDSNRLSSRAMGPYGRRILPFTLINI